MTGRQSISTGALNLLALAAFCFFILATAQAQEHHLQLIFTPSSPADSAATAEYQAIWASQGPQIVEAMQERTGLRFQESEISVEEDHPYLFLYLYDVWVGLYGREFADAEVVVESARKGYYDYEGAWRDVLALTESARLARWEEFLASRRQE